MSILVTVLLFVPGLVVARALWRRVSRPNPSARYLGVAAAVTVSGFFALQFLTMFVLASFGLSRGCTDINDCYFEFVADAFRWWYLGLFAVCGALAYVGMRYCGHMASAK